MTGGAMREAAAQQPTMDTRAVEALRGNLVTQLTGIGQQLDTMRRGGMPALVTYTDANMTALLETLAANSAALGIPISGTTREERFRSLNNWLNGTWQGRPALAGRNRDSPIDQASLDELRTRLTIALSTPGATAVATAVAPAVSGPAAAQPSAAVPVPVPVPSGPTAVPGQPAAPTAAQPAAPATASLRDQHSGVLYDLEFITAWGRTAAIRQRATALRRDLTREFDARRPSTRTIEAKLTQARTLITAELSQSEQRATEERRRQFESATGQPHPLAATITALAADSAVNAGLQAASGGRVRVSDIWLLDDASMRAMAAHLQNGRFSDAVTLFNIQQAAYLRIAEITRQTAQSEVAEIHGSSLPTRQELEARERRDGVPAGTYYNRRVPAEGRITRRIPTARSDLEAVAQRRVDAATAMAGQQGRIAYYALQDLYDNTVTESRMLHYLVSLWDYANSHGLSSYSDQATFYQNYAQSAALFVAPELNPFRDLYTRDQQDALIRAHLNLAPGTMPTAAQRTRATRELTEMLMRNQPRKYDYTIFNVFEQVVRMNPPSGAQGVQRLASVRSLRLTTELEYLPYLRGVPPILRDDAGRPLSDDAAAQQVAQLPQHRFRLARAALERAAQAAQSSGMLANDPVLVAARTWLTNTQTAPAADRLVAVSDTLYNMTLDLLSVREAELWVANPSLRPASGSSVTTGAQEQIRRARDAFIRSFSTPQVGTTVHPNLSRRMGDDATNMLMPPAYATTEASGMYFTRARYMNVPAPAGAADTWQATDAEQRASALAGEQLYLTFLTSMASGSGAALFGPSAADTVLSQAGLAGPARALNLTVGRANPLFTWSVSPLEGFPEYEPVLRRMRPTVSPLDTHQLPAQVQANPNLANHNHEDVDQYVHGEAYVEVSRQFYMAVDPSVDPLLRGFEIAPSAYPVRTEAHFRQQDQALKDRMIAIAREYGLPADRPIIDSLRERMMTASAAYSQALAAPDDAARTRLLGERLTEANRLMLVILDVRIAQLDARLSGNVMLADGQPIPVRDLARSSDPRKYAVVRAQEMLAEARALRTRMAAAPGADYFTRGGADPREAIGIAEMGISSLTDTEITPIPRPVAPQFTAVVPSDAITRDRNSRVNDRSDRETIITFTATRTMITPQGGREVALADYERANGRQNLTYYWFMFQDIQPATGMLLLNPQYRDPAQPRYSGMIMRGVTTTEGRTGDFVVRVRRVDAPSRDLEWAPVAEADGRVRPENILFEMNPGTMNPVRDARLDASIRSAAFARQSNQQTVVEFGPITPVLIVRPSATNAPAPAAPAATARTAAPAQPAAPASSQKRK
ncbi:hypothetical protein L0Y65_06885 [Candidatus Micrarchaeota archaeon]|nr:hypothetical protein [Candidatus Micrarchaeota archaeon]